MHPWRSRILTALPRHWPAQMEIIKAVNALAAQIDEEKQLRKQAEAAEAQRRQDELRCACGEAIKALRDIGRDLRKAGFNASEPRVPAGNADGGRWTHEDSIEASNAAPAILSDVTPDDVWRPGAQYAGKEPLPPFPGVGHNQGPPLEPSPQIP
jgi:hypothetical protein